MLDGKAVPLIGSMRQCQWARHCQNSAHILATCLGQVLRGVSARQVRALLSARGYGICIGHFYIPFFIDSSLLQRGQLFVTRHET